MDSITSCLALALLATVAHAQTMPTGCTYADGLYECSHATLSSSSLLPLSAAGFNPIPQRLRLTELTGSLTSALLDTDFANISTASYDTNYPATLELECINGASITVAAGFLANAGYVEDFKILNCHLGVIPSAAFSELGELDRFTIENGTATDINAAALSGVTIRRNTTVSPAYPRKHGELRFWYLKYNNTLDTALLTGQSSMYSLVIRGMGLTSITSGTFDGVPNLRYIDLSDNNFGSLPSDLFSTFVNLGVIRLYGTSVACSCSELWYVATAATKYLTLEGDVICTSNTSNGDYVDKLAWKYYNDLCVSEPEECSTDIPLLEVCFSPIEMAGLRVGFVAFVLSWVTLGITINTSILLLEACLSPIEMAGLSVGFVAFVLGWVTLGITINTKKNMGTGSGTKRGARPGAKKKPAPKKKGVSPAKDSWA